MFLTLVCWDILLCSGNLTNFMLYLGRKNLENKGVNFLQNIGET